MEFMNLYMFDEGEGNGVPEESKPPVEETPKPNEETPQPSRKEIMREISKELGLNIFEAEGMQKVKSLIDSQKTEQEKLQERLQTFEQEKEEWQKEKTAYESKLKASELGIKGEYLEDALKLAEGNPDNLAEVVKKYPVFKQDKNISIGRQDPNNNQTPKGNTEAEQYLAEQAKTNPAFAKYLKR